MTDDALYQDRIVTAAGRTLPGLLEHPSGSATTFSPFCGDQIRLDIRVSEGVITAIGIDLKGCLLSQAAAAVLADVMVNRPVTEVGTAVVQLDAVLGEADPNLSGCWTVLDMFLPVRRHKSRHDCVRLPFTAMQDAIAAAAQGLSAG